MELGVPSLAEAPCQELLTFKRGPQVFSWAIIRGTSCVSSDRTSSDKKLRESRWGQSTRNFKIIKLSNGGRRSQKGVW